MKSRLLTSLLAVATSAAFAGSPAAKNPQPIAPSATPMAEDRCHAHYDFVDLQYQYTDLSDGQNDYANGAFLKYCQCLGNNVLLLGGAGWTDVQTLDTGSADVWSGHLGFGYRLPLLSNVDLVPEALVNYTSFPGGDDWGGTGALMVRAFVTNRFEIYGGAGYGFSFQNEDPGFNYNAGIVIGLTQNVGLNLGGHISEDATGGVAGLRFSF